MRFKIGVFVGLFLLGKAGALELGLSGGLTKLAGDNINESQIGLTATVGASHTLIKGVDYILGLEYARVGVEPDSDYVYKSLDIGVRWYPGWKPLVPYLMGSIALYDWKIEHGGKTATNSFTQKEMKSRSLGLGGGMGFLWQLNRRMNVDVLLTSHFIFSQNPQRLGPTDQNELILQATVGLWYKLF